MGNQAGSRFGQDGPNRITVAPSMLTEASEVMPYEPVYYPVVPFLPPTISGPGGIAGAGAGWGSDPTLIVTGVSGEDLEFHPGNLDLHWWQGDDVVIRLEISDSDDPDLDLSYANGCIWTGQVRVLHDKNSTRAYDFSISTEFVPADVDDPESLSVTKLALFLHRDCNRYRGVYHWDLQCRVPTDLSEFPKPDSVPAATTWPPTSAVKTYFYGLVYVTPEVSVETPGIPVYNPIRIVWPNGRVP